MTRPNQTAALVQLLVRLGAVVNQFPPPGPAGPYDRAWDPDSIEVHVRLTLGEARTAYPALHKILLGYLPDLDPPGQHPERAEREQRARRRKP